MGIQEEGGVDGTDTLEYLVHLVPVSGKEVHRKDTEEDQGTLHEGHALFHDVR